MSKTAANDDRRSSPTVVWLRQDLRIHDNPALLEAAAAGGPVIPLYVHDDRTPGRWAIGGAAKWWLARSLEDLGARLAALGSPLVLRQGVAERVVAEVVAETGAGAVFWNRCYEPFAIARDAAITAALTERGVVARSFNAALLHEPWEIATQGGGPFHVFGHFLKHCQLLPPPGAPLPAPDCLVAPLSPTRGESLAALNLEPSEPGKADHLASAWTPGSDAASARLDTFIDRKLATYHQGRNDPDRDGTSRLSPHLRFGEIGPRQIVHALDTRGQAINSEAFVRELYWREFSYHLLYHRPHLPDEPLRPEFAAFPWANDPAALAAWSTGRTGFPIIDAGMTELARTGWMHNRVRMVVASFLVKDLLLPWQAGEAFFWDMLVDADLAANAANWQWVAGCGTDAAPYFRIFNPVLQGEKFDPRGRYVRRWLPELRAVPDLFIHRPWEASPATLAAAGLVLGRDYPNPILDHALARRRALSAYQQSVREGVAWS